MIRCWSCEVLAVVSDVRFEKRDSCNVVTSLACWLWNPPQNCTRPPLGCSLRSGDKSPHPSLLFQAISVCRQHSWNRQNRSFAYCFFYQLLYLESFVSFPFSTLPPHAARILLNNNFTCTLSFQKTVSFSNINFLVRGSFSLFSLLSLDLFLPSFFPSLWGFCKNVFWYLWQTC